MESDNNISRRAIIRGRRNRDVVDDPYAQSSSPPWRKHQARAWWINYAEAFRHKGFARQHAQCFYRGDTVRGRTRKRDTAIARHEATSKEQRHPSRRQGQRGGPMPRHARPRVPLSTTPRRRVTSLGGPKRPLFAGDPCAPCRASLDRGEDQVRRIRAWRTTTNPTVAHASQAWPGPTVAETDGSGDRRRRRHPCVT